MELTESRAIAARCAGTEGLNPQFEDFKESDRLIARCFAMRVSARRR
jgi:hypothetical protein